MPNTETKAGLALGCIFIAAFAVTLACMDEKPAPSPVEVSQEATFNVPSAEERMANLLDAIRHVESSHNDDAFNAVENARGGLQIRPILVRDANRIIGRQRWTHDDAWDFAESAAMFETIVLHYGGKYAKRGMRFEEYAARIWSGGPTGPDKTATIPYWHKVLKYLQD